MVMTDHVQTETAPGVLTIRLNRPDKLNAITTGMYGALADAMGQGETDESVRVIVLTGAPGVFSAGNDLTDVLTGNVLELEGPTMRFIHSLIDCTKVLVAEVDGPAIGIGTTALLHCDLVYATARTKFGLPFVKLGIVPEAASSLLLPRVVGPAAAANLLLFGDVFSAQEAASAGLVTEVLPDADTLRARVADRVAALLARPPLALAATRRLMRDAGSVAALHARAVLEAEEFKVRVESDESRAQVAAVLAGGGRRPAPPAAGPTTSVTPAPASPAAAG
jgi:enoyl-CoA hydratase/carnithine racemase